jgi:hypothetical protein
VSGQRQRRKLGEGFARGRRLRMECLEERRLLSLNPIITEIDAANSTGIVDTAGSAADWLEICNPNPQTAVNLAGWSLKYQKTGSSGSTTWTIPSATNVILGPNESRVFFCDSTSATDPVQELHTNFNLSKAGATVQLINASGTSVSTLTYPALTSDISYGVGETVAETDLVAAGATATYYAPTSSSLGTTWTAPGFNDSTWASGPTGLGYSVAPGFATTLYRANVTVASVAQAEAVISTPSEQASAVSQTESSLNFMDTGGGGHFGSDTAFPGMTVGEGLSNYVLQATGTITITSAQAGYYTFGVNSDDGFSLTITGADFTSLTGATNPVGTNTMAYVNPRGAGDTLGTTYLAAGSYPVNLVYYQAGGSAELEFYGAKESSAAGATSFDANSILVGATTATTVSGGTSTTTTPLAVTSSPIAGESASSSPLSNAIQTNVSSTVKAAIATAGKTSLYSRIAFSVTAAELASLTSLTLRMQYDSGYVAYLNGVEIASSNAPASPTWNSAASEYRLSAVQATTYEDVDISSYLSLLSTTTPNVLAVQTLMATPTDQDLFVSPAISEISIAQAGLHYFADATPGTYNTANTWQPDLTFSVQHGFFSAPFQTTLTTTTLGASIYYTTDSSTPAQQAIGSITHSGTTATATTSSAVAFVSGDTVRIAGATPAVYDGSFVITAVTGTDTFTYTLPTTPSANASGTSITATDGTLYTGPITISTTTDLRAVSVVAGGLSGIVSTESYIFPAAVINQPAAPSGYPTVWGEDTNGNPEPADYAMNAQITQNSLYSAGLVQDLESIPTISITTDVPNMWSATQSQTTNSGIYTNDANLQQIDGVSMVVPASFEYFNASGSISVQQNMGLQMEGGVGRYPQYDKHSFRMEFSSDYGPSSLNYPLFSGDPVTSFQNIDLKSAFNDGYTWTGSGSPGTTGGDAAQYMRDVFASNSMLAMGRLSFSSQYVVLYIDGLFWGIYYMVERPDANFAASHLGGTASDYEANNAGHEVDGSASNLPYWNELQNLPTSSPYATTSLAFYEQAQGNNAWFLQNGYGTTNYTDLLDTTDYIDYMLMNFYVGNTDWPWHNFYAAINTVDPAGFQFFPWDAEMSLGLVNGGFNSNVDANVLGISNGAVSYGNGNGVATLYAAMFKNPEFDLAFADQAQQFLFNGGALTPAASIARYQTQINTIQEAMVLESARWGNISTSPGPIPNTQAAWLNTANWITGTYLPQRTSILISQLQAAGLYPTIDAPAFYVNGVGEYGGTFNVGNLLTMSCANLPAGAAIYYTLDGSDPRLLGGAVSLASDVFRYTGPITLTQGEEVRARVYSGGAWSAIAEAEFQPNLSSLRVTEVMYDPAAATAAEIAAGYTNVDGKEDFEFLEIENVGAQTLPLGGLQVSGGVSFTFPQYEGNLGSNPLLTVAPNSYVVVVSDLAAFTLRYGGELQAQFGVNWQNVIVAGQYTHHLNNTSDTVELSSSVGGIIQDFTYEGSWYPQTQGGGFSLTVRSSLQAASLWGSSAGWEASGAPNGTPGTAETTPIPSPGAVVVDEVLANPTTAGGDMIELYNTTSQAINVGNWWLSDSGANLAMYQIAANTSIGPGSYLVLTDAKNYGPNSGDPGVVLPFVLNKYGFTVCLSSNAGGVPGGYQQQQTYGATPPGISAGLITTSTGESDFVLLATPSFGQAVNGVYAGAVNGLAYVSPVVMTELQYDPPAPTAAETAAGYTDGDDFEYLELYNRSNTTQTLNDYYLGSGVGFTFGWVPDGTANESETLESGATATWTTSFLAAGTYTVYADYSLTDPDGNTRSVDGSAQYTITYPGGSTIVTADQSTAVNGQLNLGPITTTGPGAVTVQLMRQSTAKPSQWTLANQVEFVRTGVDVKVGSPALTSFATTSGITTLAPGAYVLLVSDIQAFDFRYGSGLPVAGQYTGHQNNGGELMSVDQFGAADPSTGYLPSYETDNVNYGNVAPWPTQPAGNGPALIRVHVADYGNDPLNWMASGDGPVTNVGAGAGAGNLTFDPLPPTVPTGLAASEPNLGEVLLTWTASTDTRSDVAYYIIDRNGSELGTSTTNSYADTTAATGTNYTYTVAAVNRDGCASAPSASIVGDLPGILDYDEPDSQHVEIYFNEPLTAASATLLGNYTIGGGIAFSAATLALNGTKVTLTTSQALSVGTNYTVTISGLATVSGNALPATQTFTCTYVSPTWTATMYQANWGTIGSVESAQSVIDSPSSQAWSQTFYPSTLNYTAGSSALGHFTNDALLPTQTSLGMEIDNYIIAANVDVYIPAAGNYTFDVASDDGFSLTIAGADFTALTNATNTTGGDAMEFDGGRGTGDTFGVAYLSAGYYPLSLVYFQGTGPSSLEVSAAAGSYTAWNGAFELVGDTADGGLATGNTITDTIPPAAPANLRAAVTGNNNQVALTWSPVQDLTSGIDHYDIYRDGSLYATSTTTSYMDSSGISSQTRHSYQVAAVNYGGVPGAMSLAVSVSAAGIASIIVPTAASVLVTFTEPVDPTTAQTAVNYSISGGATVTSAVLQSDNCSVLLTTSALGSASYTLTVNNIATRTGAALPTVAASFTYMLATSVDIGSPGVAGSSVYNAGTGAWTITGGGGDVWEGTDQCQYLYAPATTNTAAVWIMHVASVTGNSGDGSWTKAGLMARASTSVLVADAFTAETSGNDVAFQWTSGSNTAPNNYLTGGTSSPQWIEMTYDGKGDFSSYYSNSSSTTPPTVWTQLGSQQTVAMPAGGFDVGLFVTAHNNSSTSTAVFDYNNFLSSPGYVAPPFTVAVNPLTANTSSPAIGGTVSDPAASLSVRVNGNWYAVANNNGAWTLPAGELPPLANGTYDVAVRGINAAGQVAYDSTVNELIVANANPPTVTLPSLATQTGPFNSLGIVFSEPVSGFSVQNLQLTLNGTSLPLDGTTLTTSDNQHWTLGSLSGITDAFGTYALTVSDAGWGITDNADNVLSTNATVAVVEDSIPTVAVPANTTPTPVTGTTTSLSVLGADINTGANSLTYTWAATTLPSGAAMPVLSVNASNAASDTTAIFSEAGNYIFTVTIADPYGLTTTSTVNVTVNRTLTSIVVAPASTDLSVDGTLLFAATVVDQFGNVFAIQPALAWSVNGAGTIDDNGNFTPPYTAGSATVVAASGSVIGACDVTFPGSAQWTSDSSGSWNSSTDWTGTVSGDTIAAPGLRDVAGDTVVLDSSSPMTVTLDGANPSVAGIVFNSSAGDAIDQGSGGTLQLDNGSNNATITVAVGNQAIGAPILLTSDLVLSSAVGSSLAISNAISGAYASLTVNGLGMVILGGTNSYGGGTIVTSGTLELTSAAALASLGSLMVSDGSQVVLDTSSASGGSAAASLLGSSPSLASGAQALAAQVQPAGSVDSDGSTSSPSPATAPQIVDASQAATVVEATVAPSMGAAATTIATPSAVPTAASPTTAVTMLATTPPAITAGTAAKRKVVGTSPKAVAVGVTQAARVYFAAAYVNRTTATVVQAVTPVPASSPGVADAGLLAWVADTPAQFAPAAAGRLSPSMTGKHGTMWSGPRGRTISGKTSPGLIAITEWRGVQ